MIVTLCGSARFEALFHEWNERLTLGGHTVFGLAVYPSSKEAGKDWYSIPQKALLDAAHVRKIAASDAVLVLNYAEGYVGESTLREMAIAEDLGKPVFVICEWLWCPPMQWEQRIALRPSHRFGCFLHNGVRRVDPVGDVLRALGSA